MAQIRDFHKAQASRAKALEAEKENEKKQDTESYKNKIARYRQLRFYSFLAVLAVAGIIGFAIFISWKNKVYTSYEVIQQSKYEHASDSQCIPLIGNLVTYSKDGMSCTDMRGKLVWNLTYEMQNPIVRKCGKTMAVGDYNGRNIYIASSTENLGKIETTLPIRDFAVSESGIVAAVLDDANVTAIYIYDRSGEQLAYFKTTMSKSGYPIAIDISADGTLVAVSYINADNGKISSSIGFYNFSPVGQNYTDNLVSAYGYSQAVVPYIKFMNNDTVAAVADNRLMFYQGRQKPENISDIMLTEEILSVFNSDSHIGLVFYDTGEEAAYRLEIYNTKAQKELELGFDMEYTDISFSSTGIIISNDHACKIYDWDGREKYSGDFVERIVSILPTASIERYHLVLDDAIQLMELK